jgi:hypothetical protein
MPIFEQIKKEVMDELGCKGVPNGNIETAIKLTYEKTLLHIKDNNGTELPTVPIA